MRNPPRRKNEVQKESLIRRGEQGFSFCGDPTVTRVEHQGITNILSVSRKQDKGIRLIYNHLNVVSQSHFIESDANNAPFFLSGNLQLLS